MNISDITSALKRNKFLYFSKYRTGRDYRTNLHLMNRSEGKDKALIRHEMSAVRSYWSCPPLHYVRYGLFERALTEEQILDYIPPYYFYNYYLPKQYSRPR